MSSISTYLIDGIRVTRSQAIRTLMLSDRLTRAEAMDLLDSREVVPAGGADERGRPRGEVVRKVVKEDWPIEARSDWRGR